MPERRRFTQTTSLQDRLCKGSNAVAQAGARCPRWALSAGLLVRQACRAETASHTIEWLESDRKHLGESQLEMAIYRLLEKSSLGLGPKEVNCIIAAYEQTLHILCVKDRDDPLTEMIAKKIIKIAQTGVDDAAQLSALVIADLGVR